MPKEGREDGLPIFFFFVVVVVLIVCIKFVRRFAPLLFVDSLTEVTRLFVLSEKKKKDNGQTERVSPVEDRELKIHKKGMECSIDV